VFVQGVRVFEHGGSKENCLFAENWVIIANDYLGKDFMCGTASATPPAGNNDKFRIFRIKGIPTRLRMT
jgi:hypothetical protein